MDCFMISKGSGRQKNNYGLKLALLLLVVSQIGCQIPGCIEYGTNSKNEKICKVCTSGLYVSFDELSCSSCAVGCASCDSNGVCQYCKPGLYLSAGKCLSCGNGCSSCEAIYCSDCSGGYTFDKINRVCNKCNVDNCNYCDSSAICRECHSGYDLSPNGAGGYYCNANNKQFNWIVIVLLCLAICLPITLCCGCLIYCWKYAKNKNPTQQENQRLGEMSINDPNPFLTFGKQPKVNTVYGDISYY